MSRFEVRHLSAMETVTIEFNGVFFFQAQSAIKEYMNSTEFMKWPVFGGGQWGDDTE